MHKSNRKKVDYLKYVLSLKCFTQCFIETAKKEISIVKIRKIIHRSSLSLYLVYRVSTELIYLSLAMLEFLDIDLGDISKSESDRYRNDSRRCGKFCRTSPVLGEPPSMGERAPCPFSTSKLEQGKQTNHYNRIEITGLWMFWWKLNASRAERG